MGLLPNIFKQKREYEEFKDDDYLAICYIDGTGTDLTLTNILEKAKVLSNNNLGKNLLLVVSKGSQDVDNVVNSFTEKYDKYCETFKRTTNGKAYGSVINWAPFSYNAAIPKLAGVINAQYVSKVDLNNLALILASFFTLPFEISGKIKYIYVVDKNINYLDQDLFAKLVKDLVTNTDKLDWDHNSYVMPANDNVWRNNMQVFRYFLKDIYMGR